MQSLINYKKQLAIIALNISIVKLTITGISDNAHNISTKVSLSDAKNVLLVSDWLILFRTANADWLVSFVQSLRSNHCRCNANSSGSEHSVITEHRLENSKEITNMNKMFKITVDKPRLR